MLDLERLFQNLLGQWKRIHARARCRGITGIFQPFHHLLFANKLLNARQPHFQRRSPTVEGKFQTRPPDLAQQAPRGGVPALADHVHLYIVHRLRQDQVQVTGLVRLMLAAGDRQQVQILQPPVAFVIFGRQRLFEPRDAELDSTREPAPQ